MPALFLAVVVSVRVGERQSLCHCQGGRRCRSGSVSHRVRAECLGFVRGIFWRGVGRGGGAGGER